MTAAVAALSAASHPAVCGSSLKGASLGLTLAPRPAGEGPYPSTCQTPSSIRVRVMFVLPSSIEATCLTTSAGVFSVPPLTVIRQWSGGLDSDIRGLAVG